MCRTYLLLFSALLIAKTFAAGGLPAVAGTAKAGFEENKGQVCTTTGEPAPFVRYRLSQGNTQIFLLDNGIAFQFNRTHLPEGYAKLMDEARHDPLKFLEMDALSGQVCMETYRMDMLLEGADPDPRITTEGRSSDYTNYYTHSGPEQVPLDVHTYGKVTYHDVWPGIDWVVYKHVSPDGAEGMKYDFVVRPGANPSLIKLRFEHHEELYVDADGQLIHGNRMGRFLEELPVSFQNGAEIPTCFVLEGNTLCFALDHHDPTAILVIDPARIWGTYFGGSELELGRSCAVDTNNNVYLAGYTRSPSGIATTGGHQTMFGGGSQVDAFLAKFTPDGTRLWSTYYGGMGNDAGYSCVVANDGNVYMAGHSDTPATGVIAFGGHQTTHGGNADAILVKFAPDGTRIWGTYYGGTAYEEGWSCALDSEGNVYLSGLTASTSAISTPGAHQAAHGGGTAWDSFLVKFNSDGVRQWGTYYGGTSHERGYACAVDGNDHVYLAGWTQSGSAIATMGAHQPLSGGFDDAFLVKFDPDGTRLWGTYYGGTLDEQGRSCTADGSGHVYLAGVTNSPTSAAIGSGGHQNTHGGGNDSFLVKFDANGTRQWGTYYGGPGNDESNSCTVDGSGNVYLAGQTNTSTGVVIASGGHQNTHGGSNDAFLAKFNASGARLWGTYYGGTNGDAGNSCTVDDCHVYLAGFTNTPTSTAIAFGGHQNTYGGATDAFLVKFEDCTFILSVDLIAFTATLDGHVVDLRWATASEQVNAFFTVLRSANGIAFHEVLYVAGEGNSSVRQDYHAIDPAPLPGLSYYKLRQTDLDGTSTESHVVAVWSGVPDGLVLYPNPATDHVILSGNHVDLYRLRITDTAGRVLLTRALPMDPDDASVPVLLSLHGLAPGHYLLVVEGVHGMQTLPLVKQ